MIRKQVSTVAGSQYSQGVLGEENHFTDGGNENNFISTRNYFDYGNAQTGTVNVFREGDNTIRTGVNNIYQNKDGGGSFIGINNSVRDTSTSYKRGINNTFWRIKGQAYGIFNDIENLPSSTQDIYGTFNRMRVVGTGKGYGGYFSVIGPDESSFAAIFNDGSVIANESGGNNDFRMESEINTHAFWLDADRDLIVFGSSMPDLTGNGDTIAGTTVNFAADFDKGTQSGTAIGIGSREFLLDGVTETNINNGFAPLAHLTYDLGYSNMDRAWDDVYADDFVNVSDEREKNSITDIGYGLDEVLKMRPVAYRLNKDPFNEQKLGLIAQEVLPIVNEAVKTHDYKLLDENDSDFSPVELERMGIKYQQLIPVLIKATQEQNDLIKNQQKLIEELQKEVDLSSSLYSG